MKRYSKNHDGRHGGRGQLARVFLNLGRFVTKLYDDLKTGDPAPAKVGDEGGRATGRAASTTPANAKPSNQWAVGYLLLALFIDTIMNGMTFTHMALTLENNGETSRVIGWVLGMSPISIILGAPLVPSLTERFGIGRVLITSVLVNGFLVLILALSQNTTYWGAVRFVNGFVIAIKWLGFEIWLNSLARVDNRGRIMALYTASISAGFGLGGGIAGYIFNAGLYPYIIMMGLSGLATLPLLKIKNKKLHLEPTKPKDGEKPTKRMNFWFALTHSPLMMMVAAASGVMAGASGMIAVQMVKKGFNPDHAGLIVAFYSLGPACLFPLVGYIVNEWSPRIIIPISGLLCAILAWPAFYTSTYGIIVASIIFYGTMEMTMYSSMLRSLGQDYGGQSLVAINSAVITAFSVASMIAAPLAGGAMTHFGALGLPLLMMSVGLVGVLVLFYHSKTKA